jgi:hypothetical protein
MKTYVAFSAIIIVFTMLSCQKQGTPSEPSTNPQPLHREYYVSGQIVASFVDTITLSEAELFVHSLDLTPVIFIGFETATLHSGVIGVPIGKEQLWVDSLNTYTSIIKKASRLALVEES